MQQDIVGSGVKEQLEILCNIYALNLLHKHLGEFLVTGSITAKQGVLVSEQLRCLYSKVLTKVNQRSGSYQTLGCGKMRHQPLHVEICTCTISRDRIAIEPSLIGQKINTIYNEYTFFKQLKSKFSLLFTVYVYVFILVVMLIIKYDNIT